MPLFKGVPAALRKDMRLHRPGGDGQRAHCLVLGASNFVIEDEGRLCGAGALLARGFSACVGGALPGSGHSPWDSGWRCFVHFASRSDPHLSSFWAFS
eukprot:1108884-Pyramimonas_sp.AAC.1